MGARRTTASRALTVLRALAACCLLASCTGVSGDQGGSGGRGVSGGQSTTASSAGTTVDPYGLLNAEVPALCDHSAGGRLINGSLPDAGAQGGRVSLRKDVLSAVTSASSSDVLAIGTDPSAAIAAAVSCEQQEGAARSERHMSWPDAVVVWDDAFNLVAWVDLSGTEGERGHINAIEISGTDMQIKWTYAGDGDQTTSSGTYSAQGHVDVAEHGRREPEDVSSTRGEDVVRSAISEASGRSGGASAPPPPDGVSPQAWQALTRVVELGVSFKVDKLVCEGGLSQGNAYKGESIGSLGKPVSCVVPLSNDEAMVFGLDLGGWNDYRISSAYASGVE